MFRRRRRPTQPSASPLDPIVFSVTRPLTREVAEDLAVQAQRLSTRHRIVIDLTAIPAFDTDGAFAVARLQERLGGDVVTIVGMRQAAARLTGAGDLAHDSVDRDGWETRRMRNLAVVQGGRDASADDLDSALSTALEQDVAIVVADLRGVTMTVRGVDAIAFASSAAAVRGQELLVVNVDVDTAERLRAAGLSATTFVAPGD